MSFYRCLIKIAVWSLLHSLKLQCTAFQGPLTARRPTRRLAKIKIHSEREHLSSREADEPWTSRLIDRAEVFLDKPEKNKFNEQTTTSSFIRKKDIGATSPTSRRMLFAMAAFAAGTALGTEPSQAELKFVATPVNKRTGVTVFDAEKDGGYNLAFITYLSRFLLVFDQDCQRWWYSRGAELPRLSKAEEIESIRLQQFAAFSASVEVGLQFYKGKTGPTELLSSLIRRYCPDMESLRESREAEGLPPLGESAESQKSREIKEARRQLAILFAFLETNQPVDEITKILAAIDNGSIYSVDITDGGGGYAPGYGAPFVQFPPPDAGPDYETATGRAVLVPTGKLLRLDVVNRGFGYQKPPTVTISPPEAAKYGNETDLKAAEGKAILFKVGPNKGRIQRLVVTDPGQGYSENEIIRVKLTSPEMKSREGGVLGTGTAVLEYKVGGIKVVNQGSGYAVEKPINIVVDAPPITARVNMNDPMIVQLVPTDQLLPDTALPTIEMKKKMPALSDPSSAASVIQRMALRKEDGSCVGRACYDTQVQAVAYATAEKDSYSAFRNNDDAMRGIKMEASLMRKAEGRASEPVSGSSSGAGNFPPLPSLGLGTVGSSAQLLSLLPEGIGLEYDKERKLYIVRATPELLENVPAEWFDGTANKPLDPQFGPRGRSPIEREKVLGLGAYARFAASGAVCCSGVHLALTPIDVVKTKVQTNPMEYPGVAAGFQKVLAESGPSSFFTGWAPTFVGFFIWGGATYTSTEYLRRLFSSLAGLEATRLEVPIILAAASISATMGSFILCPFEAVRIRSVALSGSGAKKGIFEVLNGMIAEEGIGSLFSAVPAFLGKEIPFNAAKFVIFDLATAAMYDAFPVAREDLQLSLLVSLLGGTLGGVVAAVVSNPADATITEMKKAKSKKGPIETATLLLDEGGPPRLFAGVALRMVFYSLVVSLQFLVYDAIRFSLGIGADDLKLYLDVLGGALSETGGPI